MLTPENKITYIEIKGEILACLNTRDNVQPLYVIKDTYLIIRYSAMTHYSEVKKKVIIHMNEATNISES